MTSFPSYAIKMYAPSLYYFPMPSIFLLLPLPIIFPFCNIPNLLYVSMYSTPVHKHLTIFASLSHVQYNLLILKTLEIDLKS